MKVVIFNGPPESGKDTAGQMIIQNFAVQFSPIWTPFAKPLKEMTHKFFNLNVPWDWFKGEAKDQPLVVMNGMTPRQAYIWMSEEVIKPKFGKEFLGRKLVQMVHDEIKVDFQGMNQPILVITDCGFDEELVPVYTTWKPENCILFQLHRKRKSFANDSRKFVYPPFEWYALENEEGEAGKMRMKMELFRILTEWLAR